MHEVAPHAYGRVLLPSVPDTKHVWFDWTTTETFTWFNGNVLDMLLVVIEPFDAGELQAGGVPIFEEVSLALLAPGQYWLPGYVLEGPATLRFEPLGATQGKARIAWREVAT